MALLVILMILFRSAVGDVPGDGFAESATGPRETELISHADCGVLLEKVDAATAV